MLERIHRNRTTVVCPVIDVISWEKLEYSTVRGPPGVRGGFNWGLQFKWKKIPNYEQKRRGFDETREVKSPTMAGGLFAIDTKFFFDIGSYDTGMDIWGAENLEISFRVSFILLLLPYSRKYWRKLNLAVEPQIAIKRILADFWRFGMRSPYIYNMRVGNFGRF